MFKKVLLAEINSGKRKLNNKIEKTIKTIACFIIKLILFLFKVLFFK